MIRKTKGEYRTKSGKSYFRFSFEKQEDGEVNIFVIDQPSYKGKSSNFQMTHRRMKNGKICIDIPHNPKTMADAFRIAKHWSEKTEHYVNTGTFTMEETDLLDNQRQGHYKEPIRRFRISEVVFEKIHDFIGKYPAERGGILGRNTDGVIEHFEPDSTGRCTTGAYDPDLEKMNRIIKQWKKAGIIFCGFAHSHPLGVRSLSSYDRWYAGEILAVFKKLEELWLPLVMTSPNAGRFEIIPYAAIPGKGNRKQCSVVKATLSVIDSPVISTNLQKEVAPEKDLQKSTDESMTLKKKEDSKTVRVKQKGTKTKRRTNRTRYYGHFNCLWKHSKIHPSYRTNIKTDISEATIISSLKAQKEAKQLRDQYLLRLSASYDIDLLDRTRLIVIGTGGGASLVRNAVRMGIGEVILIDPDKVSASNICTQQVMPLAIGHSKVETIAKDITKLNPAAAVLAITDRIEQIGDEKFSFLLTEPLRGKKSHGKSSIAPRKPQQTILLVLTDNFWAQARGHRLGLNFHLPTICAQEYAEGRGAEVTYTIPGVTPACHRCMTASRYRAYLKDNYKNDVTSEGAPVFGAEFLNSILGHILLGVAFHRTDNPRWGEMITRLGNRNLIRVRMDPNFDKHFGDTFGKRHEGAKGKDSLFMLDSLFLPQTPDYGQSDTRPVCPDCKGTGDLRDSAGRFSDTREMRPETINDSIKNNS